MIVAGCGWLWLVGNGCGWLWVFPHFSIICLNIEIPKYYLSFLWTDCGLCVFVCVCVCVCVCLRMCVCTFTALKKMLLTQQQVLYLCYTLPFHYRVYIVEYHLSDTQTLFLSSDKKLSVSCFHLFWPLPSIYLISASCFSQDLAVKSFLFPFDQTLFSLLLPNLYPF